MARMAHPDPAAPRLAALAALLADATRAAFCLALLDGRAWTAGELARYASVAPSTASEHLGKLVAGGLLAEERQGRHRYLRLADERIAHLVEDLAGRMGATTYAVPALVVLMSWLLLDEVPAPLAVAGGLLCLAGVAVSRTRPRRSPEPALPSPRSCSRTRPGCRRG